MIDTNAWGTDKADVGVGFCADCERALPHHYNNCPTRQPQCLDRHLADCEGEVEYRMALSGTGVSFPRCDAHWSARLDFQEAVTLRYPTHAPADFDPSYAGECWDEDY